MSEPREIACPGCGGTAFRGLGPRPRDEDRVVCAACGHDLGAYAEFRHLRRASVSDTPAT